MVSGALLRSAVRCLNRTLGMDGVGAQAAAIGGSLGGCFAEALDLRRSGRTTSSATQ